MGYYFAKIDGKSLWSSVFTGTFPSLPAAAGRQNFPRTFRMAGTPCHLRERRNNNSQTQKAASSRAKGKQEQARQRAEPNGKNVIQRKRRTNHPAQQNNDMKFNVNSDEMGKSIQGLAKMVSGKSSLAILDHFLFVVDDNNLHVTNAVLDKRLPQEHPLTTHHLRCGHGEQRDEDLLHERTHPVPMHLRQRLPLHLLHERRA